MLMIRFQRIGRTNDPAFRIVVLEKERAAKAGNIVEQVGTYNPRSKALTMNEERVKHWISMGAQPTDSIKNLLINKKVIEGKKVNVLPKKTPQVDEEAIAAAAKAEADAASAKAAEEAAAAAPAPAEEAPMPTEAEVVAEAEPETPVEEVAEAPTEEAAPAVEETPAA
jgi:small subunit ribosomal protein S16